MKMTYREDTLCADGLNSWCHTLWQEPPRLTSVREHRIVSHSPCPWTSCVLGKEALNLSFLRQQLLKPVSAMSLKEWETQVPMQVENTTYA